MEKECENCKLTVDINNLGDECPCCNEQLY